ncbi:hypothetical protein AB0B15_24520 [Streptomyces sp. NPDC045456]|uniref:hypothetical protein n=1 Tax=Streptomyces sp. NPDC045456 TaxID=3155254 RepID=UPI0033DB72D6
MQQAHELVAQRGRQRQAHTHGPQPAPSTRAWMAGGARNAENDDVQGVALSPLSQPEAARPAA